MVSRVLLAALVAWQFGTFGIGWRDADRSYVWTFIGWSARYESPEECRAARERVTRTVGYIATDCEPAVAPASPR